MKQVNSDIAYEWLRKRITITSGEYRPGQPLMTNVPAARARVDLDLREIKPALEHLTRAKAKLAPREASAEEASDHA